jgi:membrane protease YdiL (CAAX protease family)
MKKLSLKKITEEKWYIIIELFLVSAVTVFNIFSFFGVVILFSYASFLLWTRQSNWKSSGLSKPGRWGLTVFLGISAGFGMQLFNIYFFEPQIGRLLKAPIDLSKFEFLKGNLPNALAMLAIVWILAAFGEELVYRGYLLPRIVNLLNGTKLAWVFGIIYSSVIFGYLGHNYQGTVGALEALIVAIITCLMFLFTKKNLWLLIIFHGCYDTLSLLLVYFGKYPL